MVDRQFAVSSFVKGSNIFSRIIISAVIILTGLVIPGAARQAFAAETQAGGKATGTLSIDGKRITLKYAYAMAQPDTFDAGKTVIAVLLTEEPLAGDALNDVEELDDAVMGQHGWAFFKLAEDGKPIHEMIDHPATGGSRLIMSGLTQAEFISKKMGKDRVEGSFRTSKTEDFMGHPYAIKVDFSAPLLQAKVPEPLPGAETGRTLPKGGGQPGKAYRAYLKAVRDRDVAALREMVPDKTQNMSDSEIRESLKFVAGMMPKNPKITDGYAKEGRAVLYVEDTTEGEKQYGTVELLRKGKTWGIVKESWSNTPPKK